MTPSANIATFQQHELQDAIHEPETFGITRWDIRDELESRNKKISKEIEKKKKQIEKLQKEIIALEKENNGLYRLYQQV